MSDTPWTGAEAGHEEHPHLIARGPDGPSAIRGWRQAAGHALAESIRTGASGYNRGRMLPRLIGVDPRDVQHGGEVIEADIRARLKRAIRAERQRGVAGHWAYDLNRHLALLQALGAELRGTR